MERERLFPRSGGSPKELIPSLLETLGQAALFAFPLTLLSSLRAAPPTPTVFLALTPIVTLTLLFWHWLWRQGKKGIREFGFALDRTMLAIACGSMVLFHVAAPLGSFLTRVTHHRGLGGFAFAGAMLALIVPLFLLALRWIASDVSKWTAIVLLAFLLVLSWRWLGPLREREPAMFAAWIDPFLVAMAALGVKEESSRFVRRMGIVWGVVCFAGAILLSSGRSMEGFPAFYREVASFLHWIR